MYGVPIMPRILVKKINPTFATIAKNNNFIFSRIFVVYFGVYLFMYAMQKYSTLYVTNWEAKNKLFFTKHIPKYKNANTKHIRNNSFLLNLIMDVLHISKCKM